MDRRAALQDAGVSIWLDTLSRDLLDTGEFAHLVEDRHVTGATSNPTIFARAITSSDRYDEQLRRLVAAGEGDQTELFFALALEDVRRAADILRPVFDRNGGADGFVSFECTPDLADDTEATIHQARDLWARLDRPNVMIKVPATAAGIPAVEQLTAEGVNINITLLFSLGRYQQVLDAFQAGLEARVRGGQPIETIVSVASCFVSRVDAFADHGTPRLTLDTDAIDEARAVLEQLAAEDVDLDAATAELEREGVESFAASYNDLRSCIDDRVKGLAHAHAS